MRALIISALKKYDTWSPAFEQAGIEVDYLELPTKDEVKQVLQNNTYDIWILDLEHGNDYRARLWNGESFNCQEVREWLGGERFKFVWLEMCNAMDRCTVNPALGVNWTSFLSWGNLTDIAIGGLYDIQAAEYNDFKDNFKPEFIKRLCQGWSIYDAYYNALGVSDRDLSYTKMKGNLDIKLVEPVVEPEPEPEPQHEPSPNKWAEYFSEAKMQEIAYRVADLDERIEDLVRIRAYFEALYDDIQKLILAGNDK